MGCKNGKNWKSIKIKMTKRTKLQCSKCLKTILRGEWYVTIQRPNPLLRGRYTHKECINIDGATFVKEKSGYL